MKRIMRKCPSCGRYTLRELCPSCGVETVSPHPPPFRPSWLRRSGAPGGI